ncbi:MAG: YciI family protein [Deltaproteobacteria bacterium]
MKYLALIYAAPANAPQPGTPDFDAMMSGYATLTSDLQSDGAYIVGEGLKPVETATSVRVRSGKIDIMDGPFAETKEQLAGFYLMEVADLDAAITWAARIPTAGYGTIELRPLMSY